MHGAPQTHVSMRLIAPELAKDYTVVVPDLRGYGDSSKPPDGENHANYSKRAMALDQVEVMKSFGFDKFAVVGTIAAAASAIAWLSITRQDHEAGRTRHRADVYLYTHVDIRFIQSYFHWFNNVRAAPAPETTEGAIRRAEGPHHQRRPAGIPAHVERSREHPRVVRGLSRRRLDRSAARRRRSVEKDRVPLLTLWGLKGPMGRIYDVLAIWKERGTIVTGKGLGGGHNLQEDVPEEVLAELRPFLK
jgi:haloacetate dehalogenase